MGAATGLCAFFAYHRRMSILMLAASLLAEIPLILHAGTNPAWAIGFALGAAAQLGKFFFLDAALVRKMAADSAKPASLQLRAALFSILIFGLMAGLGLKAGANVWAMAAGVFLPRLILLADAWIRPNPFPDSGAGAAEGAPE